jgi:predicted N-acyltransferase
MYGRVCEELKEIPSRIFQPNDNSPCNPYLSAGDLKMMQDTNPDIRWYARMADIDQAQWDRLALPLGTPLLEWQWLYQLEASGSIAPAQGWHPCHLTVWQGPDLVGAAPLYIKTHSDGEFVFDHGWARLAADLGVAYYPKLVGMSPVTPAVGYRFLSAPGMAPISLTNTMVTAMDALCRRIGLSGSHLLFVDPQWEAIFRLGRFMQWQHQSYLWHNPGYTVFEDYLKRFNTNQRRNIRREVSSMARQGIAIQAFRGEAIPAQWASLMYACYLNTNQRYGPWAAKFLNDAFFERLLTHHRERLLIIAAFDRTDGDTPLALSLLLVKGTQLIGRYWGATRWVKDLHFNMCFYAPIKWAIDHQMASFDPGAGSTHKIYRGFEAVANFSLHRFHDPRLQEIFRQYIGQVNQMEQANIDELNIHLPFAHCKADSESYP